MLSRKVLSLTKPKGKIYKIKSLSHYITHFLKSNAIYFHNEKEARKIGQQKINAKTYEIDFSNRRKRGKEESLKSEKSLVKTMVNRK